VNCKTPEGDREREESEPVDLAVEQRMVDGAETHERRDGQTDAPAAAECEAEHDRPGDQ
jgi:hypothetical protein